MTKEIGNFEPSIPLNVHSEYSILGDTIASGKIADYIQKVALLGYPAFALIDSRNFFGALEAFSQKPDANIIPGVELPLRTHALAVTSINLLAKNPQGVLDTFHLTSKANQLGELNPGNIEPILQEGNMIALYPWASQNFSLQFAKLPNVYVSFSDPSHQAREAARNFSSDPAFLEKIVIAHDIRMANTHEQRLVHFLQKTFPDKAKRTPPVSLNNVVQSSLAIAALYAGFPKAAFAHSREIGQDCKPQLPQFKGIKPHLPASWSEPVRSFLDARIQAILGDRLHDPLVYQLIVTQLDLAEKNGFLEELAIALQAVDYCHSHDIPLKIPGSFTHSYLSFALGMTATDPIHLWPHAFLGPHRSDLPDLDTMVPANRQETVQKYLMDEYPDDAIHMSVVKRMGKKKILHLAKQHHLSLTPDELTYLIHAAPVYEIAKHPSALLFQKQNLPVSIVNGLPVAQVTAKLVEVLKIHGKLDILRSISMERTMYAKQLINQQAIPYHLQIDDQSMLHRLRQEHLVGISYLSPHMQRLFFRLTDISLEHIVELLALARPAGANFRNEYYQNIIQSDEPFPDDEFIDQVLNQTQGRTMVFKEQRKQLELWLQAHPDDVDVEQLIDQTQGYAFWKGHAEQIAQIMLEELATEYQYPPYFYASVLKSLYDYPASTMYSPQGIINQSLRRTGHFIYPAPDQLPTYPTVINNHVTMAACMLQWQVSQAKTRKIVRDLYNQLLMNAPRMTQTQQINYELEHFRVAFANNPVVRFPRSMHFHPRHTQTHPIIGSIIAQRDIVNKRGEEIALLTIDSGQVFSLAAPLQAVTTEFKPVDNHGYYQFKIRKNQDNWELAA